MEEEEEAIVCFENVTGAIMAEEILAEGKFCVGIMPTPSGIRGGCGFCLRFLPEDLERAAAFLFERGLAIKEAYMREEGSYKKIPIGNN